MKKAEFLAHCGTKTENGKTLYHVLKIHCDVFGNEKQEECWLAEDKFLDPCYGYRYVAIR